MLPPGQRKIRTPNLPHLPCGYNDVNQELEAYIHAGSSNLTLGNPSIGWQTNFSDPTRADFIPKQFILNIAWSVEDLGYDASDNLSVIVRVDGKYVDGTVDIYGNEYDNANEGEGVVVTKVKRGSPAADAGIRKGMVILEVNRTKISNVGEFNEAIEESEDGKAYLFVKVSRRYEQWVVLPIED